MRNKLGVFKLTIPDLHTEYNILLQQVGYEDYLNNPRFCFGVVGGLQIPFDEILTLGSFDDGTNVSDDYGYMMNETAN